MPEFIKPQLATLRTKAPTGDYLHEIKYDGYRVSSTSTSGRAKPTAATGSTGP